MENSVGEELGGEPNQGSLGMARKWFLRILGMLISLFGCVFPTLFYKSLDELFNEFLIWDVVGFGIMALGFYLFSLSYRLK